MKTTPPPSPAMTYPMRINKYLAHKGYSTRRGADELITSHKIIINGRIAVLGDKVQENDVVEVRQGNTDKVTHGSSTSDRVYFVFNKPVGTISTNTKTDPKNANMYNDEDTIDAAIKNIKSAKKYSQLNIFPIGRLERKASGLMILTSDGRITDRLLNPAYAHEKVYEVTVDKIFSPSLMKILGDRLAHAGAVAGKAKIEAVNQHTFSVTLHNAGNANVERVCSELGFQMTEMKRVRTLNIELGAAKIGGYREIKGDELKAFLAALGL